MCRRTLTRIAVLVPGTGLAVCVLFGAPASASQASGQATAAAHAQVPFTVQPWSDQVFLSNPNATDGLGRTFT